MPYKYVAAATSKAFSDAPSGVMQSLSQVTWAAKTALKERPFQPFNECLVAGYMEKQQMGVSAAPASPASIMLTLLVARRRREGPGS